MKIVDIELFMVRVPVIPIEEGGIAPYLGSQDKVGRTQITSAIYKVTTNEGIIGWGEMNPILSPQINKVLLDDFIKPRVIGRNPFHITTMMDQFDPGYNPHMNIKSIMSAIEIACWDIMGKSVGKPIYDLIGGKCRDRIDIAYAFGIADLDVTKEKVLQIKEEGFNTLKTKGGKSLIFDINRAKVIREAGGPDFNFRVDMNQGYDTSQTLRYLKAVEDFDLEYIEQPIKINQFDNLAMLRQRTKTPIAINEDCYIPGNLMECIRRNSIDVGVVDFEPLGGISELIRLAKTAEEAGLSLAHHCAWDMGIRLAAILQATCALPAFTYPVDSTYIGHKEDILVERIKVEEGSYLVPEGPGLGVEVDEEKIRSLSFIY